MYLNCTQCIEFWNSTLLRNRAPRQALIRMEAERDAVFRKLVDRGMSTRSAYQFLRLERPFSSLSRKMPVTFRSLLRHFDRQMTKSDMVLMIAKTSNRL